MERRKFQRTIILPDGNEVERTEESKAEAKKQLAEIAAREEKKQQKADSAAQRAAEKAAKLEAEKAAKGDQTTTDK